MEGQLNPPGERLVLECDSGRQRNKQPQPQGITSTATVTYT